VRQSDWSRQGRSKKMNKKSATVLIFIFILIVMFFLFPKSCGEGQGRKNLERLDALVQQADTILI
jgi:hypothetical protein